MPELRKDPVVGRWVIIATERARRPGNVVEAADNDQDDDPRDCPFCHIDEPPIYTASLNGSNGGSSWDTCVVPFRKSFLTTQKSFQRENLGLYQIVKGFGVHEVIIETSEHIANMANLETKQIRLALETYVRRINELEKSPHLQYVLLYKNFGPTAGGRNIGHSRSHIVGTPIIPERLKEKLTGSGEYFQKSHRCIYCDIVQQELHDQDRIIVETEFFLAVVPFAARFMFETWIIPKKHHYDFAKGLAGYENDLAKMLKIILQKMKIGLDNRSYNYVIHTAPFLRTDKDAAAWPAIKDHFHWHIEILPHLTRVAGFEKGTDFYICAIPPEQMASYLRGVESHV